MKRLLRGSSSRSSKEKQKEEEEKPKFNLPRTAEVRPCEWPSDDFLRRAGIYDDFYELAENAGLTDFLRDQREQYLLLTNTFVQNFHFHARRSPPSVDFYLYDCRCQNRRISGRGSRTVRLGSMVTRDRGHNVYPGSDPLYGGNTLRPS